MRVNSLIIRVVTYSILCFLVASCESLTSTQGFDSTSPENSFTYDSTNSVSKPTARAISVWSTAENISGDVTVNQDNSYLLGPKVLMGGPQDSYIRWGIYDNSSIVNGYYTSGTNHILKGNNTTGWFSSNPQGETPSSSAFLPSMVANKNTGELFTIWQDAGLLYTRNFHPDQGWVESKILGYVELALMGLDQLAMISSVYDGEVSSIWINNKNDRSFSINISNYSTGQGWSVPTSFFRTNNQLNHVLTPVKISPAKTLFVWIERAPPKFPKLMSIEHDQNLGWGNPTLIRELATTTSVYYAGYNLKSIGTTGDAMLVYEIKENGNLDGIYAHKYLGVSATGTIWQDVVVLDDNTNNLAHPHSDMVTLASNEKGELAALWTKNKMINNQESIVLAVNRYSPVTGWAQREEVTKPLLRFPLATPQDPGPFNLMHSTNITIDSAGIINIAWGQFSNTDPNTTTHQLITKHSHTLDVWSETTVLDTSNGFYPLIVDLSMDVGVDGAIRLAWRHETRDLTTGSLTNYSIWSSYKDGLTP